MSESQGTRAERMARYKEERRRQLAAQFGSQSEPQAVVTTTTTSTPKKGNGDAHNSSSSETTRTTRTTRLRKTAFSTQETSSSHSPSPRSDHLEKSPPSSSLRGSEARVGGNLRLRDKSSKRKSNLNRSLNSEEVPHPDSTGETKLRRRRRRFFPPEVLEQSLKESSSNDDNIRSDRNSTASVLLPTTSTSITASSTQAPLKKSELSIHMENARRGITPAYSEMGKQHRSSPRRPHTTSREKSTRLSSNTTDLDLAYNSSPKELNGSSKISNKENIRYRRSDRISKHKPTAVNDLEVESKNISKRMDHLTALTKETLVRVEKLANKSRDSPKRSARTKYSSNDSLATSDSSRLSSRSRRSIEKPSSILKKKSIDDTTNNPVLETVHSQHILPVSILKRKVSQDEHRNDSNNSPSTNTPVTFSPSVIDHSSTKRKQGILKKRRSLDESQVLRHRSCSPDVAVNGKLDARSILKDQRRSSLEDIIRMQSPDSHLQGILKRKSSKTDEEPDVSLNSPQGILKRRSGGSSAGSVNHHPHVSITTAVILAAAGGAEMVLNASAETVRPILKKKSFSDDQSHTDTSLSEAPKPILKKKSSTDTDDTEDRPKPILKAPRNSLDNRETIEIISESRSKPSSKNDSGSDCDVKPILKQPSSREESPRSRLSFCSDADEVVYRGQKHSRRSHTVCTDFNINGSLRIDGRGEDSEPKPRTLSVSELVMSFEKSTTTPSTGAIPKRSSFKRNSDRFRTQPITFNELEASLSYVQTPSVENIPKRLTSSLKDENSDTSPPVLDFTTSLENDSKLNGFSSYSFQNSNIDSGVGVKMSSDSAFQSLGDGLELEEEELFCNQNTKPKLEPSKLELQMKAIAEEAKSKCLSKGNTGMQKYRNKKNAGSSSERSGPRFSTQPVTLDEVQEASRLKKDTDETSDETDPSNLSLSERIKMFNVKVAEQVQQKRTVPKRRFTRFQTQPVTSEEVESAKIISPNNALDLIGDIRKSTCERKGILKSKTEVPPLSRNSPSPPKSVLKKRDSFTGSVSPRSILKLDAYDEGISSNDSGSESEMGGVHVSNFTYDGDKYSESYKRNKQVKSRKSPVKFSGDDAAYTSDGESSGGREVRSIINHDDGRNRVRDRSRHDGSVLKSKSQSSFRDEAGHKKTEIHRSLTQSAMPRAIAELQAKLQQSSDNDWRKRISKLDASDELTRLSAKNLYNEELSEKSILAARKNELDASLKQWRTRVEKNDAIKFSVAGRMNENKDLPTIPINISKGDKSQRVPEPKKFKGKEGGDSSKDSSSTPVSPILESNVNFKRSISVPGTRGDHDQSGSDTSLRSSGRKVTVFRPDDASFSSFFKSVNHEEKTNHVEISVDDFDLVTRDPQNLLVQKKNIQVQRRRGKSRNPVKALATRSDIKNEYTEVITGVAEREKHRLNVEKLAKSSSFAIEALAGLASKEDFASVALKKSRGPITTLLPYKDLMLLQVKGRRHVQTRLVEPSPSSLNQGDNFILVTPKVIYNFVGTYSNIIEQSRAADIINHIQRSNDLGCKPEKIVTINSRNHKTASQDVENFWKLLGCDKEVDVVDAGHPDEDIIYDSGIIETNMAYVLEDGELVPLEECWRAVPKVSVLQPTKVIVFDFGSEMYVWSGKNAAAEEKKCALKLAKEMWDEGYNYTECSMCPINVASVLGFREEKNGNLKKGNSRPDWALFAKLTQHRETILFKEKFLDWPDFSRVIKVKDPEDKKEKSTSDPNFNIQPCDSSKMLEKCTSSPDLVIESTIHLGRGDQYFNEETRILYEYDTLDITCWCVTENTYEKLDEDSLGQFFDGDSYILRWQFRMTVKGRELSGKPSRHSQIGRDRTVFFCWQGNNSSINEKGAAAVLTVELDIESAPQVFVTQGMEPCAFLKLFKGHMVVHCGKRDNMENCQNLRLYYIRGEVEDEVSLTEVPCSAEQLRSRTSFVLCNCESGIVTIWHGSKSSAQTRSVVRKSVDKIIKTTPVEFQFYENCELEVYEIEEGEETDEFWKAVSGDRHQYMSLLKNSEDFDLGIRLFHLSSVSGSFEATELLCPHRSNYITPYPFLQSELYSVSQPALFMLDNGKELWLWQGWWPDHEENTDSSNQTGSGAIRWQMERRAAMQTAINYWQKKSKQESPSLPIYLVWAGLEPLAFTNLFPNWINRDDVTELNIKEGKKPGEAIHVEKEFALLTRSTYPLAELLERPLPEGVDPRHLEMYLSPEDFQELLCMSPSEFYELPAWKKSALKKEKGLF